MNNTFLTRWLSKASPFWFAFFTGTVAFLLYTCIYGFRKTFAVATFDDIYFLGISYKIWLVTSQVLGYAASKFIGIKVVSEMTSRSRALSILILVTISGLSMLFFALFPAPVNIFFLFTNGLPLGMTWGLIFAYLEGRQTTEGLGAALSVSFIFSGGFVKTVGFYLMMSGISEFWMPFTACCIFMVPLLLFLWLLEQVPPPTLLDKELRTERVPMDKASRKKFMRQFAPGLVLLILAYMMLTAFRDFRDNFSAEIWTSLGYGDSANIFTSAEIPVSIIVLIIAGSMMLVKNNQKAFSLNHWIIITGFILTGLSTLLFEHGVIGPVTWMVAVGTGLYLGYVPFNSMLFERLIATFKYVGTVGFVMYLADAFGYLGSVGVLFFKELGFHETGWLSFFMRSSYLISIVGVGLMLGSLLYFERKSRLVKQSKLRSQIPAIEPVRQVSL